MSTWSFSLVCWTPAYWACYNSPLGWHNWVWGFKTYGNSRSFVDCGGLKENRPHRLIYSNACTPVSEIVCEGLEGVVLLEKVQTYWRRCVTRGGLWGFKSLSQTQCYSLCLLPLDKDVKLSDSLLPAMMITDTAKTVSQPPIKCFILWVAYVLASLHSNRAVTKAWTCKSWKSIW